MRENENFQTGDVVYALGSSAILGDVLSVDAEGVRVAWRPSVTIEQGYDLTLAEPSTRPIAQAVGCSKGIHTWVNPGRADEWCACGRYQWKNWFPSQEACATS